MGKSNPCELYTPSIFAISSPFQVMCAMATLKQLHISRYRVVVCYQQKDPRNKQLWEILNYCGMNDRVLMKLSLFNVLYYRCRSFFHVNNIYKRLFIGDYRGYLDFILGTSYVSDKSDIVYLDDGLASVSLLKNVVTEPMPRKWNVFLKYISRRRGFVLDKNLLTIYSDIPNNKYNIFPLDLSYALPTNNRDMREPSGIVIVGTNIDRYCDPLQIDKADFIRQLEILFDNISREYPHDSISFFPHGRDKSCYAQELCHKYGYNFIVPSMMIEIELIKIGCCPKVVFGFTSTALYNIKKLFPRARVVNVLYEKSTDNIFYQEYLQLSDYYIKNNIELRKVVL